ncbi:hypothetical protein HDV63DRAFT_369787 [Trichoderma sp. SZMC 28014]
MYTVLSRYLGYLFVCMLVTHTVPSRMDAMSYVARQRDGRVAGSYESRAPFITASIAAILIVYTGLLIH